MTDSGLSLRGNTHQSHVVLCCFVSCIYFFSSLDNSNFGLKHAGEGSDEYGDVVGAMGGGLRNDEGNSSGNRKCYNGPHSWHMGWYSNRHLSIDNDATYPRTVTLTGLASWTPNPGPTVILRIKDDTGIFQGAGYYIMYNHDIGINEGTEEALNQVTVVKGKKNPRRKTELKAKLSVGQSYNMDFAGTTKDVRVIFVGLSSNGVEATVRLERY